MGFCGFGFGPCFRVRAPGRRVGGFSKSGSFCGSWIIRVTPDLVLAVPDSKASHRGWRVISHACAALVCSFSLLIRLVRFPL